MIIRREQGELLNNTTDIKAFEKADVKIAMFPTDIADLVDKYL